MYFGMINRSITGIITCSCVWFSLNFDLNSSNDMGENLIELQNKKGSEINNFRPDCKNIVELHPKDNNRNIGQKMFFNGEKKKNCLYWIIPSSIIVGGGLTATLIYFLTRKKSTENQYNNCNNLCFSENEKKRIIEELSKNGIKENVDFSFCPEKNKDFYVFNLSRNITMDDVKQYYEKNINQTSQINFATDFDNLICNIAIKDPQSFFSNETVKEWLGNNIIGLECTKSGSIKQDNFSELFKNYSSLYYVDISKINLSDVLSMEDMFYGCSNLTEINADWQNTINCTDMSGLFYNCSSLKNITSFTEKVNVTNVEKVDYLFSGCFNLKNINCSKWNLSKTTSSSHLFENCGNVEIISLPQFSEKLENISYMFSDCEKLSEIYSLEDFNPVNVTNAKGMFSGCSSLSSINLNKFTGSELTNIDEMFLNCTNVRTIDLSSMNFSKVENYTNCLLGNSKLTKLYCQQSEEVTNLLKEFFGENTYYADGLYVKYQNSCSTDLDVELKSTFNKFNFTENIDYFFNNSEVENNMIKMLLNDECFLSINKLYSGGVSIFNNIEGLKNITFIKNNLVELYGFNKLFFNCTQLETIDFHDISTQSIFGMYGMFYNCTNLKDIKFGKNFKAEVVYDMRYMFYNCISLRNVDLSNFKTDTLNDVKGMFYNCSNLNNITFGEGFNATGIYDMTQMFYNCISLRNVDLSNFKTDRLNSVKGMFYNCRNLNYVTFGEGFNATSIYDMTQMFYNCTNLRTIDLSNLEVKNLIDVKSMFENCENLSNIIFIRNFTLNNVLHMNNTFSRCINLKELNLSHFNTESVINMHNLFFNDYNLEFIYAPYFSINSLNYDISENILFHNNTKLKKMCCTNDNKIRQLLLGLWGKSKVSYQDNCFIKEEDQCKDNNIKNKVKNIFDGETMEEGVNYFWRNVSNDTDRKQDSTSININNDKCIFSVLNSDLYGKDILNEIIVERPSFYNLTDIKICPRSITTAIHEEIRSLLNDSFQYENECYLKELTNSTQQSLGNLYNGSSYDYVFENTSNINYINALK